MLNEGVKLLGHPVHQMLVVFPLGLLGMAWIFDVVYLLGGSNQWEMVAFWMIGAGIISGLVAAVFGLLDWSAIPSGTRAKNVGLVHACVNVSAVALFLVSWLMRKGHPVSPGYWAVVCSFLGLGCALVGGWLGGELIDRLGIGVASGANPDAPSSLSTPGTAGPQAV